VWKLYCYVDLMFLMDVRYVTYNAVRFPFLGGMLYKLDMRLVCTKIRCVTRRSMIIIIIIITIIAVHGSMPIRRSLCPTDEGFCKFIFYLHEQSRNF